MRKNLASRALGLAPFLLVLGSCSLVYDLSPDQCGTNADCTRFGEGVTCDAGICTCHDPACMNMPSAGGATGGGGAKGGNGGTSAVGGTSASGGTLTGGDAGMADVGGTGGSVGGTGGKGGTGGGKGGKGGTGGTTGGTSGNAGAAGAEPVIECTSHSDCFTLYEDADDNPRACVNNVCVPLMSDDCPVVLPNYDKGAWNTLKSTDAIILGAFAPLNGSSLDTIGRNYDLAVRELSQEVHGVFAGSSKRHELVFVVCHDLFAVQADLLVPAKHLIEDLQVPGIVSALLLQDQQYIWENVAQPAGTFMMMPLYSDQALINTSDEGLIWHMLSGANALSVSYQPLLDLTVDHLKGLNSLGMSEDLKVAHVKAQDEPFLNDTSNYLEAYLQFNGQSVSDNFDADLYDPISIQSIYSAPADPQTAAINSILAFAPHVVIGTTVSEMLKFIIPGVESGWETANPGRDRPFYLLGALDYNDPEMPQMMSNDTSLQAGQPSLYQRVLGVNWPAAEDPTVYDAYQTRYKSAYGAEFPGYENFYDAVYYLMYGVAAARQPLTGAQIAKGLLRVTDPNATEVEVGPNDDMATYVYQLSANVSTKIELLGAMGPPNWDEFGARNDAGSIWCVNTIGGYAPDQMRYNSSGTLDGKISCFTFDDQP
jgi:hypothetical protein